jgi:hypothetical protein
MSTKDWKLEDIMRPKIPDKMDYHVVEIGKCGETPITIDVWAADEEAAVDRVKRVLQWLVNERESIERAVDNAKSEPDCPCCRGLR